MENWKTKGVILFLHKTVQYGVTGCAVAEVLVTVSSSIEYFYSSSEPGTPHPAFSPQDQGTPLYSPTQVPGIHR